MTERTETVSDPDLLKQFCQSKRDVDQGKLQSWDEVEKGLSEDC